MTRIIAAALWLAGWCVGFACCGWLNLRWRRQHEWEMKNWRELLERAEKLVKPS